MILLQAIMVVIMTRRGWNAMQCSAMEWIDGMQCSGVEWNGCILVILALFVILG